MRVSVLRNPGISAESSATERLTPSVAPSLGWTVLVAVLVCLAIAAPFAFGLPTVGRSSGFDSDFAMQLVTGYGDAVRAGHLFPRWLPEANGGLGSPVFYFYGRLPFLVTALITVVLHVPPSITLVLAMVLFRLLAFFTCRLWLRGTVSARSADLGALLFLAQPFAMTVNPLVRVGFAEIAATALLPLLLWCIDLQRPTVRGRCLPTAGLAAIYALLAATHPPQLVLACGLVSLYALLRCGVMGLAVNAIGSVLGVLISGSSVLPALFTRGLINAAGWSHDPSVQIERNFLFTASRYKIYGLASLDVSLYASWFLCLGLLLWSWRTLRVSRGALPRPWVACAGTLAMGLLAMTPVFKPLWMHVDTLRSIQFPWRVFPVTLACASALAAGLAERSRRARPFFLVLTFLIVCQLAAVSFGAYLTLSNVQKRHPALARVAVRLPLFVSFAERDRAETAVQGSCVPEYVPRTAVDAGWFPGPHRTDVEFRHQAAVPASAPPPTLPWRRDLAGDLTLDGNVQQPTSLTLPTFFYPDERTQGVLNAPASLDRGTGLARIDVPAGAVHLKLVHDVPVNGVVLGHRVSVLGSAIALVLLLVGIVSAPVSSSRRRS